MRHAVVFRSSALLLALALACPLAFAQQRIEQEMTPEQFKAAGLDKLSAESLGLIGRITLRMINELADYSSTETR